MKRVNTILSTMALCMVAQTSLAQDGILLNGEDKTYLQSSKPSLLSNYNNGTYFVSKDGVHNLLSGKLYASKKVGMLSVNPNGSTYAVVNAGGKEKAVEICNLWKANKKIKKVSVKAPVSACCFSADGNTVLVADANNNLTSFDAKNKYKNVGSTVLPFAPTKMVASGNGKLLAIANAGQVAVLNMDTKEVVANLNADNIVNSIEFASDSKELSILSASGTLCIFNTRNFELKKQVSSLGDAVDMGMHPESKYVSVITGGSRIALINLTDNSERYYVDVDEGGATDVFFAKDAQGVVYMVYNTDSSIHYKQVSELSPYLGKMVEDEVERLMADWEKRMPEETDEQYAMRVNEETRAAQMRLYEEQVATRMAGDYANTNTMQFSKYNPETGMMELDFDNVNPIYLNVDNADINSFMSADDVELRNPIYAVGDDDKYQLVYADVYNKKTGKTYTFDNRERKSLEYLTSDDGFMPLEYAQQNNTNAMQLDEIKNDVVTAAKASKSISEHTKISVNTEMVKKPNTKNMDYKVSFGYTVDAAFSAKEDFPSGCYNFQQSKAGQTMFAIIKEALNNKFSKYMKEGKKVTVKITGSTDAAAIKKTLKYAGEYGDLVDRPVIKNNENTTITVTKKDGIKTNDQLGYLRATGMRTEINDNITDLKKMNADYQTIIEQAEGVGGQFRRIFVDFIFEDAFE